MSIDPLPSTSANGRLDGRRQRSERTRRLIIEAYLKLLPVTGTMPTAAQIASEAGCSQRSIYERFTDLDALNLATADYAIAQGQAEAAARHVDAERPVRIRSHVETRALACEKWLPLWRILLNIDKPELRQRVALVRFANVQRLRLMYGPELALVPDAERSELVIALAALTSFESWDQLRHCYDLSIEAGQAVWRGAIERLLPRAA